MPRASNEADSCSKNSFVDPLHKGQQILVERLKPGRIKLLLEREAGLPVPVKDQWQAISHDVSSQNLKEMVLQTKKHIRVKLEQLLGQDVQGDPTIFVH